jgi:hypothetical protein
MKLVRYVADMEEMRTKYKILIRKREEQSPLGIPSHAWEDIIKTNLKEVRGREGDLHLNGKH